MEDEDEATPPSCVTHLATRTSSVVRYSESTRSSFLTISPSLCVFRVPLKKKHKTHLASASAFCHSASCGLAADAHCCLYWRLCKLLFTLLYAAVLDFSSKATWETSCKTRRPESHVNALHMRK